MDYSNVSRWTERFKRGRESTSDLPREGRPSSARSQRSRQRAEQLILADGCMTVEQIALKTGVSKGTAFRIIRDDLQMAKVNGRWVPRMLDDKVIIDHPSV
ncbi:hypothetical protein C0J52_19448 [Blattella germanica]|nr:hypothetical protein C0J52_19448 [Blattella germanica]